MFPELSENPLNWESSEHQVPWLGSELYTVRAPSRMKRYNILPNIFSIAPVIPAITSLAYLEKDADKNLSINTNLTSPGKIEAERFGKVPTNSSNSPQNSSYNHTTLFPGVQSPINLQAHAHDPVVHGNVTMELSSIPNSSLPDASDRFPPSVRSTEIDEPVQPVFIKYVTGKAYKY